MSRNCKKVVLLCSEFPPGPGGIGDHAHSLCISLSDKDIDVTVLAITNFVDNKAACEFDRKIGRRIKVVRAINQGSFKYLRRLWVIFKVLISIKYDVFILSGKFSLWMGAIVKILSFGKVRTMAVLHGSEINMTQSLLRKFTHFSISTANIIIPVSRFTHSLLTDHLKSKAFKIIANGVVLEKMQTLNDETSGIKLKGSPILLTVGQVNNRKGQHRVVKALLEIKKAFPDVHYHMVGLPTNQQEIESLADELGVLAYITIHGRLPLKQDLFDVYKQADCFMILSENQDDGDVEGFGIVILEANYFGIPAIGAIGSGIEDAINDDYNGYLVDGNDGSQITNRLQSVLKNMSRLNEGAVDWAKQHDWNNIGQLYITELENICKK